MTHLDKPVFNTVAEAFFNYFIDCILIVIVVVYLNSPLCLTMGH